jgi:predicted phosphodiesterase
MPSFQFIHFSDIHFGQEKNGALVIHDDVRNEVIADCRRCRTARGAPDGILVTGDIAYSGKPEQYRDAGDWLDRVAEAVGCPQIAVHTVPGNHDVNVDAIDKLTEMVHTQIRDSTSNESDGQIEQLCETTGSSVLLTKLSEYREFASIYGCDIQSPSKPFWTKELPVDDARKLKFAGLTSVLVSDLRDGRGNLVLGPSQYVLPREDNIEFVVMIHHPLDWFKNRANVEQYLRTRARVIFLGHEHLPAVEKIIDERGGEHIVIRAGSITPPYEGSQYGYTYNWVELSVIRSAEKYSLKAKVYPRIWCPSATKFTADTVRAGVDDYIERSAIAPNFSGKAHPATSGPGGEIEIAQNESREESLVPVAAHEDETYAKLRYYFWKYLGWRERLKVLVDIDILPEGSHAPVPQVLERMALQKAREQGRLEALWDAIMQYVPEPMKKPNPYSRGAND